jgi:hypothetical protein
MPFRVCVFDTACVCVAQVFTLDVEGPWDLVAAAPSVPQDPVTFKGTSTQLASASTWMDRSAAGEGEAPACRADTPRHDSHAHRPAAPGPLPQSAHPPRRPRRPRPSRNAPALRAPKTLKP